jgi:hypothetical protein
MESAVEGAFRGLIRKHKELMAPFIASDRLDKDVIFDPFSEMLTVSHAPQLIVADSRLAMSRRGIQSFVYLNKNIEAGTADEYRTPTYFDVFFTLIVVGTNKAEAWQMVETLLAYYGSPGKINAIYNEGEDNEFTLSFGRDMVGYFIDRSIRNDSKLVVWEGQARLRDVPIYDSHKEVADLVKELSGEIIDGDGPDDETKQSLETVTVKDE